jgi:prolyl-tRNA synthetase
MADSSTSAIESKMEATNIGDTTAAINTGKVEPQEVSKNAAKKAAKQEKLAAEKANKSAINTTKETAKAEAKKAVSKAPKKKIEGAALIGIDVSKEEDFSGWYQQVLTKGDMLDYYDVSGCYILKVTGMS